MFAIQDTKNMREGVVIMPITMAQLGDTVTVVRIGGTGKDRQRLIDLGFVEGTKVSIIQSQSGNLIVKIKNSTLAITREMASKIFIN